MAGIGIGWSGAIWQDSYTYQITFDNVAATMNGFNILRISNAISNNGETSAIYENPGILVDGLGLVTSSKMEFYPNPFSPNNDGRFETTRLVNISALSRSERISVKIYNLKGVLVRVLFDEECPAGEVSLPTWDGKSDNGFMLPIGVYLYQVRIGNEIKSGTVVIAK